MISSLRNLLDRYFRVEEGGKRRFNKKRVAYVGASVALLVILSVVVFSGKNDDESHIHHSSKPIASTHEDKERKTKLESISLGGVLDSTEIGNDDNNLSTGLPPQRKIRYKAKQVINRSDQTGTPTSIPTGASFVGKTLTSIDTRTAHTVKVILPYDGTHKGSGGNLPRNTILLGRVSYPGEGNRVYVQFTKGVLPNGEEITLQAQAMSSKDYSPGISGELHGNTGNRVISVLGLSMIGGMSDVLVEKEALGQGFTTTPKATMRNAALSGVARVADMEANYQAQKLSQTPEYVTLNAGADLIVSLTGAYIEQSKQ